MKGPSKDGLYCLPDPKKHAMLGECSSFADWHARLGHLHGCITSSIIQKNNLSSLGSFKSFSICHACKLGKLARLPLASVEHTSTQPFEIIHSNVWGTAPILSDLGFSYFVLFGDDYTCFTWIYFLKHKSQVFQLFKDFEALITQIGKVRIKN